MKIIILGAGQVGASVAATLANEANDITVVDCDRQRIHELQDRFDIQVVCGHASNPRILRQAGAEDADMLLAVTNSDETNMVACQVAYTLFHTPTKIARVRSKDYLSHTELFAQEALPIDVLISPEQVVTEYIQRIIEFPGALQVLDFADGKVRLVAVKAIHGGPLVGNELQTLREHIPGIKTRVAAIFRRGMPIIPTGDTVVEIDDEVFFVTARKHTRRVMSELRRIDKPVKRIIIAGGGNIGKRLSKALEGKYQVKLIDHNSRNSSELAAELEKTIVLKGDAADSNLLLEENIEGTDVFCAMTNDDEANILSSMVAKNLGAKKVMALINRPEYVDLVQSGLIDIAISPQQVTIGSLLTHVRRGDVAVVHSLRRGAAEAIEAIAHGDSKSSKVVGKTIEAIKLPPGTTIGAVVRCDEVIIASSQLVIEAEDHVILFVVDKRRIKDVERLFQVGVTFL
ncbi:MAG TPA: Trk system potassium transporter TrkA [Gammaproteobacteria bacterium]|nr:Trk system potassium transporter TrkA [Gammaproteobacteria bacterium]